jgi:alpha-amylase
MKSICMYFQVHQPRRLRRISAFHTPPGFDYWDGKADRDIFDRAANKCYLPTNRLIHELIRRTDGAFKVAYSITGTFLEQAEAFRPEVIESFRELAATGSVEFLGETYYHSLAGLWDDDQEFKEQVMAHRRAMDQMLGVRPTTFRNTELIYDNRIAQRAHSYGYQAILAEGAQVILGDRSPNHVYTPRFERRMRVLMKNYQLSDDVAFRFSARDWAGYPLRADTYANWLHQAPGDTLNLFMDYETFGEHQWAETGIFQFLERLPTEVLARGDMRFDMPRDVAKREPVGEIDVPWAVSWADTERDVSAWLGNRMQQRLFEDLRQLRDHVMSLDDPELTHAWRLLQTSDHIYYACTKHMADGDVHKYFSPYDSPYVAYINAMNAVHDLRDKVLARSVMMRRTKREEEQLVSAVA